MEKFEVRRIGAKDHTGIIILAFVVILLFVLSGT